jgi:hypothetical protein
MALPAYADAADFTAWIAPATTTVAPAEIDRQLARASELLDHTVTVPFAVDSGTNLPSDTDVADALRDAACAQVEYWQDGGSECDDIAGTAGSEVRIGSYVGKVGPELAPRAERILHTAGLLSTRLLASPVVSADAWWW